MAKGFQIAGQRLQSAVAHFRGPSILFVVSDGMPDQGDLEMVHRHASDIRAAGTKIVSCFITDRSIVQAKHLRATSRSALGRCREIDVRRGLAVASGFAIGRYFSETGWKVDPAAALFCQLNHPEMLEEFLSSVLAQDDEGQTTRPMPQPVLGPAPVLDPQLPPSMPHRPNHGPGSIGKKTKILFIHGLGS